MPLTRRRTRRFLLLAGLAYLLIAVILWWHAWSGGASTTTLCGCGDPALFLWFFQWPATALAHLHNPFYSTALFHPGGINLLAQTSVMGLSVPLIPITWIWGPVASLNVASTLAPALSAFAMLVVVRRWVRWRPAAFLGGLLYGFSPSVLSSLQFAHLMTVAIMLLPLILAAFDEILVRQRRSPQVAGAVLGVLVFLQFFMSSEMLAVMGVLVVISLAALVGVGLVADRERVMQLAPHALAALVVAALVAGTLLAYPVWFALDGPAHLPGLIWPNIGAVGGYDGSSFVSPNFVHGTNVYTNLGGYEGTALPSSGYLGWGFLGVLVGGMVVWFRDRRLWFFGFLFTLCVVLSFGERKGEWEPVRIFAHLPVIENVIVQRFMVVGFLAGGVLLAIIVDRVRDRLPKRLGLVSSEARVMGVGAALGVAAIALVPIATTFSSTLPFAMRTVTLPRWYSQVAPHLPPGRVLLSYPVPFSGIQVAMAWQAVNAMGYSQAGGGGPEGVPTRAEAGAKAGFEALGRLAFGVTRPPPSPTPAVLAAVRRAMTIWQVNTVVIAVQSDHSVLQQGHEPNYAAGFMTAVIGRLPTIEAGAWVWNNVSLPTHAPLGVTRSQLDKCVAKEGRSTANLRVAECMTLAAAL
ncbi:MAG TPA: hypothetical protein VG298_00090 [Acidimicrobiales bacterium]|nr:hypothetical protein [Acidimicrobiales bacterium]